MLQESAFSFAFSHIALNSPLRPDDEAIVHLLPPEPYTFRSTAPSKQHQHSVHLEPKHDKQYVDFTLGNSPEYSNLLEPQKQTHSVSNFNQKLRGSSKQESSRLKQSQKEFKPSSNRQPSASKVSDQLFAPLKQSHFVRSVAEREDSKGSRGSRTGHVIARECNTLHNTSRNPREDTIYQGQKAKKKFTYKNQAARNLSPDKLALTNKIEELKTRMAESQNLNRTLGMQLQSTREKMKAKDHEIASLKDKIDEILSLYEEAKLGEARCKQLEKELAEQHSMNEYFCIEIDKQKEEVIKYQYKNQESLRLLQKLNENITKRQEKLESELSEQMTQLNKITHQKLELQERLKMSLERIEQLQAKSKRFEELSQEAEQTCKKYKKQIQEKNESLMEAKSNLSELSGDLKACKEEISFIRTSMQESTNHKEKLLVQQGKYQEETTKLKTSNEQLKEQIASKQQQHQEKMNHLQQSHEQKLCQLKAKIDDYDNRLEALFYSNKQFQMKLQVLTEANNQLILELKEVKEEKRVIYLEKEELKNDVKQLLDKNDQFYALAETNKRKELELNQTISTQQKQIIALEERISENIADIANKDYDIKNMTNQLENERNINEENAKVIEQKSSKIAQLQDKIKKYDRMLGIYKDEIAKIKDNKEAQWQEMKNVYEEQILILEERLKEFAEIKDSKKHQKAKKQAKNDVIEEQVKSILAKSQEDPGNE